jgi:hypothetical protein
VLLEAKHLTRALDQEHLPEPRSLLDHLRIAAEEFVREAERRADGPDKLDLDLCDAFKGLVLEAACSRWPGDPNATKKAFLLLGKEAVVKSRNQGAHLEREMKEVEKLKSFLFPGGKAPSSSGG